MSEVRIGQVVEYHGTIEYLHDTWTVLALPHDGGDRGYVLGTDDEVALRNVHRDSITPLVERARV